MFDVLESHYLQPNRVKLHFCKSPIQLPHAHASDAKTLVAKAEATQLKNGLSHFCRIFSHVGTGKDTQNKL